VILGLVLGTAFGAPFDMDVGAGHAIFHVTLGVVVGLAAWWLRRHGTADRPSQLALWSAVALAIMQGVEGLAAIPDGSGNSIGHEIPGYVNLAILQPLVLVAIIVLAVVALRRRLGAAG
jgi:hypothetical protein